MSHLQRVIVAGDHPPLVLGAVATTEGFSRATRQLLPALRGYARRLTRNSAQSDDLVQDTLIRAWAARQRFVPNSNFKAWLFTIARNCFLSTLRRSRRFVELSPELAALRLTSPATQEDGVMIRDLDRAMATLPPHQAVALMLINEEGLAYEEAATRLGISTGAAKSRVSRARQTLIRFFEDDRGRRAKPDMPKSEAALQAVRPTLPLSRYESWKLAGRPPIG